MDKQNVVCTYIGILFSLKKEGSSDTRINTEDIMLSEIGKSEKGEYCMIPLV